MKNQKATTFGSIPVKNLKDTIDIVSPIINEFFNQSIHDSKFPFVLKLPDVSAVFKKDDATNSKNYRPVSVLPAVSKVFERFLHVQLSSYFENILSSKMCGYRKGYNAQYALVSLIENWKKSLDKGGYAGAILMDLNKAFDTINHDLLIAKLHAYGLDKNALCLVKDYLSGRKQRVKVGNTFSSWSEIEQGVPQGSVLGPLLFSIYMNDLFWFNEKTDACNFADDTTLYKIGMNIKELLHDLKHDTLITIEWFGYNYMKLNQEKCHFLFAGHSHEYMYANVGENKIWESQREKLLGVNMDKKMTFKYHVTNLCKKAHSKLSALIRLGRFHSLEQKRLIMKSFIDSQFGYSPLVWMFHDRGVNLEINKVHERILRFVYDDNDRTYEELLEVDGSLKIHYRNIHSLATEMFKVKSGIAVEIMKDIFVRNGDVKHNTRGSSRNDFILPRVNTVHYGHDSLRYFGAKLWGILPENIKDSQNLVDFKHKIKSWMPTCCPCRLCKDYISGVGYVNLV